MEPELSFGDWLRRRRKALDLTQAALGRRVGCSAATIRKIEAEERRPSAQIAERLAAVCDVLPAERGVFVRFARGERKTAPSQIVDEAPWRAFMPGGLSPPASSAFQAILLGQSLPGLQPLPANNLPLQVTRFFGREAEVALLAERLAENRLVTLTGPGGVGKTRLSLRGAEESLADFPGGVWQVELAPLSEPGLVAQQVASALGLRDQAGQPPLETLGAFLRDRQVLLVLDNCEHLLLACAQLAEALLHTCARLKILATSREPLRVDGEALLLVPSLPFPPPGQPVALERLDQYASINLFVDRARLVRPDYAAAPRNAAALARICQRLDGIPLAIEMAAARLRLFDTETVAAHLEDAFGLLTSGSRTALPKQQTLRAMIDWSYRLLSEPERRLLARLAVFAGGCTLEAARAVCAGDRLSRIPTLKGAVLDPEPRPPYEA